MDNKELFRKKNLDKISSPESLTDYIRVANPGIWTLMGAILLILLGLIIWGITAKIYGNNSVLVVSDGSTCICYVTENDIDNIKNQTEITIDGKNYALESDNMSTKRLKYSDDDEAYIMHLMAPDSSAEDMWVYEVKVDASIKEGVYTGVFMNSYKRPIDYIIN